MSDRPNCVNCQAKAPETNTTHTLISASFGWRLTRRQLKDASYVAEWRCPTCWRKHKAEPEPKRAPSGIPRAPAAPPSATFRFFKRGS